ncbi:MAG TPA: ROK family protein, partial [Brevundimonas sp.]|nr:ROK family protein [Brevundimonas sp.]
MHQPLIAGFELGGTKTVCVLATGPDDVRDEVRIPTTTPSETLAVVQARLHDWRKAHRIEAIGIGSFGPLQLDQASAQYGQVGMTPKPGWTEADLLAPVREFGVPVGLDTDVNGAAIAEGLWGAAQGLSSWAYITVGTGVGVGTIVDG